MTSLTVYSVPYWSTFPSIHKLHGQVSGNNQTHVW